MNCNNGVGFMSAFFLERLVTRPNNGAVLSVQGEISRQLGIVPCLFFEIWRLQLAVLLQL